MQNVFLFPWSFYNVLMISLAPSGGVQMSIVYVSINVYTAFALDLTDSTMWYSWDGRELNPSPIVITISHSIIKTRTCLFLYSQSQPNDRVAGTADGPQGLILKPPNLHAVAEEIPDVLCFLCSNRMIELLYIGSTVCPLLIYFKYFNEKQLLSFTSSRRNDKCCRQLTEAVLLLWN